jgi:hypothetical protein
MGVTRYEEEMICGGRKRKEHLGMIGTKEIIDPGKNRKSAGVTGSQE